LIIVSRNENSITEEYTIKSELITPDNDK